MCLQKSAELLSLAGREQHGLDGLVEDGLEVLAGLGRALEVLDGLDLLGEVLTLLGLDRLLAVVLELLERAGVVAEIELGADEDLRNVGAEVDHLREPLGGNVLERHGIRDREAHEEDVGIGVAQRAQAVLLWGVAVALVVVVVSISRNHPSRSPPVTHLTPPTQASEQARDTYIFLLTGRIPEAELDGLVAGREVDDVVVEHGRDVVLGEAVVGVRDEQAGLTHSTVADHDELHTHGQRTTRDGVGVSDEPHPRAREEEQPPRLGGQQEVCARVP